MPNDDPQAPSGQTIPILGDGIAIAITKLAAAVDRIDTRMDSGFRAVKTDFASLHGEFGILRERVVSLERDRIADHERLNSHSMRAKQPSDMDLELLASQGLAIAKNIEQDRKIDETRELAASAVAKLTEIATAADARSKVLDDIASSVGVALKSKLAERIAYAFGGMLLAAIAYYARKYGAPQ